MITDNSKNKIKHHFGKINQNTVYRTIKER